MKPEQLAAAKSIVQYAAVNGLESDEVMLLGHAVQEVENLRAAILEYQQAPAAMEASADREIEYLHGEVAKLRAELSRLRSECSSPWILLEGTPSQLKTVRPPVNPSLVRDTLLASCLEYRVGLHLVPSSTMEHRRSSAEWVASLLISGAFGPPPALVAQE